LKIVSRIRICSGRRFQLGFSFEVL
jgi:hypothetical protein